MLPEDRHNKGVFDSFVDANNKLAKRTAREVV